MFFKEKGNPKVNNFHYEIACIKNLDFLDYFLLSQYLKKYCKAEWFIRAEVSDNGEPIKINLYFDVLSDFCYVKLICNSKYNFKRAK